ncbi:MAG: hypothetical protein ACREB8_00135 [Pseudolabrys sp.]
MPFIRRNISIVLPYSIAGPAGADAFLLDVLDIALQVALSGEKRAKQKFVPSRIEFIFAAARQRR